MCVYVCVSGAVLNISLKFPPCNVKAGHVKLCEECLIGRKGKGSLKEDTRGWGVRGTSSRLISDKIQEMCRDRHLRNFCSQHTGCGIVEAEWWREG